MSSSNNTEKKLDIESVRAKIDDVDTRLLSLLAERQALSEAVIQIKDTDGQPTRNPDREKSLIKERIVTVRATVLIHTS
jgi:chorismate mutase